MKTNEERYLKESIRNVKKFAKEHETLAVFFAHIDEVKVRSLQDLSFKYDLKFFESISRILSVIISIVSRPVLANKAEEVIVRSTSAARLTPEMFQKTVADSMLWRQRGVDMIPEYVYYQQYVDEIKTYENIFIVNLIKLAKTLNPDLIIGNFSTGYLEDALDDNSFKFTTGYIAFASFENAGYTDPLKGKNEYTYESERGDRERIDHVFTCVDLDEAKYIDMLYYGYDHKAIKVKL